MMKRKNLEKAVILSIILAGLNSWGYAANDINGNDNNGNILVEKGEEYSKVDGYHYDIDEQEILVEGDNTVEIKGKVNSVYGIFGQSRSEAAKVSGGTVKILGGVVEAIEEGSKTMEGNISGNWAYSWDKQAEATNGKVYVNDGIIGNGKGTSRGLNGSFAWSEKANAIASGGQVTISGSSEINFSSVPTDRFRGVVGSQTLVNGGGSEQANAIATNGSVEINGGTVKGKGYVLGNLANSLDFGGGYAYADGGKVVVSEETGTTLIENDIRGSYSRASTGDSIAKNSTVEVRSGTVNGGIYGGYSVVTELGNREDIEVEASGNQVKILGGAVKDVVGGYAGHFGYNGKSMKVENNQIILGGESEVKGSVIGGYFRLRNFTPEDSFQSIVRNNTITITGKANLKAADLYGAYISGVDTVKENSGNDLIIDGWNGKVNSINNFNNIKFQNIEWQNQGVVVEVLNKDTTTSLEDTKINLQGSTTLAGGTSLKSDDYMYFIKTDNGSMGTKEENVLVGKDGDSDNIFTAGVAFKGTGKVEVEENGNVKYTITNVENTEQTEIVPVNSSLVAAFVINGSDLVVDGLNAMEQDQLFGVKTFAIVEGHDSTYDVADDLKVNGWNGLYGVGNIKEYDDGNFSYAAFFENGTANYRTFNNFMNEVIRGDGSIVYNGGGIAGRYKKNNGFYTEASLRAGLLKNELKNMFKDGNSNIYGYKTESPYYAFHLGTGRIIDVESDKDLDLYVRYYHTYNDGDDFTVAGDRFEVDSITSDKIRVGTRYNVNNNEDVSTYYGLAWEYEFNGDADVKVNDQSLPGESLKGSSGFAEIGFVQKNSSPWSLEGRVRGYVGEREGISGLLRATYSF